MRRTPRVVVAVGGNAAYPPNIRGSAEEQLDLMAQMCEHFVRIIASGYRLVLTHGNGPVVGNILFRMAHTASLLPPMPMDVCVSHSQGGMGYMLQQSFRNVLHRHGLETPVSAIITQVEVDPKDAAFSLPTKPVGKFFSAEEAQRMSAETGWTMIEDAGRGWRRVVASPKPKRILDLAAMDALLESNVIPIVAGGGGIPVTRDHQGLYHGVAAVIDKDLTAALLAESLDATVLIMLTGVPKVALDFGKPTQRNVDRLTAAEARRHLADGQFPPGSMGPKIQGALNFLKGDTEGKRSVIITSIDHAFAALDGNDGTRIVLH